jgi:hypothetical protein
VGLSLVLVSNNDYIMGIVTVCSSGTIGQKWPQYKGLSPTPLAIKIPYVHGCEFCHGTLLSCDTVYIRTEYNSLQSIQGTKGRTCNILILMLHIYIVLILVFNDGSLTT